MLTVDYDQQAVFWQTNERCEETLLLMDDEHFGNPALWVGPVLLETADVVKLVKLMQGWLRTGKLSKEQL